MAATDGRSPEYAQYGTAQLQYAGDDPLGAFWSGGGCNGFPIGINQRGADTGLAWWPAGLKGHHIVLGSTRSGKGTDSIIPGLITYLGSAVVIDPKGENAWVTAERRRQLGHRVVILDPWGEVNRRYGAKVGVSEQATRFNPLSALDPKGREFAAQVSAIADALIVDESSDPHWSNSAKELIAGLVALVVERDPVHASLGDVRDPVHASLGDVRRLISMSGHDVQTTLTLHCLNYPNGIAAAKLAGFSDENLLIEDEPEAPATGDGAGKPKRQRKPAGDSSKEFFSVRSVARTQTAFLDDIDLRDSLQTDEPPFDLATLGTGQATLYLVLPVDKLETHGRWLRLIITLAITAIARFDTPPRRPVWFCLDEFGTIGKLQSVETAFGLLSGLGIAITAYLQGLDQLQHFYKNSWETFIGNSAVIQVLNARNGVTSNYISSYLGTMTQMINRGGYRQERYLPANPERGEDGETLLETRNVPDVQPSQRPVMFAEEVRRLPQNEQLVIYPGHFSAVVGRLTYYREPRWEGMYRPNPLHPAPSPAPANSNRPEQQKRR